MITPITVGANAVTVMAMTIMRPCAAPRSARGNTSRSTAIDAGREQAAPTPSITRPAMTMPNPSSRPPANVSAAPAKINTMPRRKMRSRPVRSPSAPPTVTRPASTIRVMFRIHWLAVTEMPSDVCMLGRATCVAAMSMAHVESPAAAASTAMRLTAASGAGARSRLAVCDPSSGIVLPLSVARAAVLIK